MNRLVLCNCLRTVATDIKNLLHHQVFLRNNMFEFSPMMISSILNTKIVKRKRVKKLDLGLDMNVVIVELTGNSFLVWCNLNALSSAVLTTKYSILYKITISNWLPKLHLTSISKNLAVLLYLWVLVYLLILLI